MFPKSEPVRLTRYKRRMAAERAWRAVVAVVRERDSGLCRACAALGRWERGVDPHHLVFRAQGGADAAENVILLCREHHRALHDGHLTISFDSAHPAETVRFE